MSKSTGILAVVVIGVVVIGGFYFYGNGAATPSYTTTTPGTNTGAGNTNQNQGATSIPNSQSSTPGLPASLTLQTAQPSDTTVVVTGQVNPAGDFTSYWFEYGTTANLGMKTASQDIGSGYNTMTTPGYITGLVKDTTYYYRLVSQNSFGNTAGVAYTFKTTVGNPAPVGSAPVVKTIAASGIGTSTANLNGQINPNKAVTQYWFEYGVTKGLGHVTELQASGDGSVNLPAYIAVMKLDSGTTYYFRINAQNQFGTANGAILSFKTK